MEPFPLSKPFPHKKEEKNENGSQFFCLIISRTDTATETILLSQTKGRPSLTSENTLKPSSAFSCIELDF